MFGAYLFWIGTFDYPGGSHEKISHFQIHVTRHSQLEYKNVYSIHVSQKLHIPEYLPTVQYRCL